jgi:hypothetical protein
MEAAQVKWKTYRRCPKTHAAEEVIAARIDMIHESSDAGDPKEVMTCGRRSRISMAGFAICVRRYGASADLVTPGMGKRFK